MLSAMPANASLFDDGATTSIFKTRIGIVPGTFKANQDHSGITVGKSDPKLETNGINIRAVWITSKGGGKWPYVDRVPYSPNALCNITSEPRLVYKFKAAIIFDAINYRRIVFPPHPHWGNG